MSNTDTNGSDEGQSCNWQAQEELMIRDARPSLPTYEDLVRLPNSPPPYSSVVQSGDSLQYLDPHPNPTDGQHDTASGIDQEQSHKKHSVKVELSEQASVTRSGKSIKTKENSNFREGGERNW